MKLFFDSSIIIETFKGNEKAVEIIEKIKHIEKKIYINTVVFSEVAYQLSIRRSFKKDEIFDFLNGFLFLDTNYSIILLAQKYIKEFNLKPNDAIISATVKYYNINYLVTLDSDYENLNIKVFK